MTYRIFIVLFCMVCSTAKAQNKQKQDLYLYFKEDKNKGYFMRTLHIEATVRPDKNIYRPAAEYDIYTFTYTGQDTARKYRYKVSTVSKDNYCVRDRAYITKIAKDFDQIKGNKNFFFDSQDTKRFPYKRLFIVQYLSYNQYKIIQVNTYIGSDW